MNGETEFRRKLTSYGRRKGKTLRSHHQNLMDHFLAQVQVAPEAFATDVFTPFGARYSDLWMEVGFGGGEHLADDARRHPEVGFIGCEPFQNGVAKLLALVHDEQIPNVRVYPGDAREILKALPAGSLGRINVLYPDPWPKTRQKKRRFITDESLPLLAGAMRAGAQLRFATDIDDYSAWTLARILRSPHFDWPAKDDRDWLTPWQDWPSTRYEAKALREGRRPAYFTFVRNAAPV